MSWARIELVNGNLSLTTSDNRIILADAVTIRLVKGEAARIDIKSKKVEENEAKYSRFFANAMTAS